MLKSQFTAGAMPADLLIQALSLFYYPNSTWVYVETGLMVAGLREHGLVVISSRCRLKGFRVKKFQFREDYRIT